MSRVALIVWTMAAPTLAGIMVLVVLVVPSLESSAMKLIAPAAGIGAVLAVPLSIVVAKMIEKIGFK